MRLRKHHFIKIIVSLLLVIAALAGYSIITPDYLPKPYGHPYIPLPAHTYVPLPGDLPYRFEISAHATVRRDPVYATSEPYWITIYYQAFKAEVQITYKPVKADKQLLRSYIEDCYKLCMKHQVRASAIDSDILQFPTGVTATFMTLQGQVSSPFQFYTTDGVEHFLRGVVYFSTSQENDYLAPIIQFIKEDIIHLLHTLRWKKGGDWA